VVLVLLVVLGLVGQVLMLLVVTLVHQLLVGAYMDTQAVAVVQVEVQTLQQVALVVQVKLLDIQDIQVQVLLVQMVQNLLLQIMEVLE
jgi:hypothetical protein